MKRLTPNHLKVMLDLARTTQALDLTEVAGIVLADAGFTNEEIASITTGKTQRPQAGPAKARTAKKVRTSTSKKGSSWTRNDDDAIIDLWAEGLTSGQIAKRLKRTPAAVTVRISQLRQSGKKIAVRNAASGQRMKAYHKNRATSKK